MHADLFNDARAQIEVPAFPITAIRAAAARPEAIASHRRPLAAAIIAGLSIATIAVAAAISQQAHLRFTPSGGMVLSSTTSTEYADHSEAGIRAAATHLDFNVTLPAGIPAGATPIKVEGGSSMLVVTYALPVAHNATRTLWIFLADPTAVSSINREAFLHHPSHRYTAQMWRVGAEQVIVVSDGLTSAGFAAIKTAMRQAAN